MAVAPSPNRQNLWLLQKGSDPVKLLERVRFVFKLSKKVKNKMKCTKALPFHLN
jgi:hypothetical protein